jgi:sugar-specific transcriptional regulator TrmB
VILKLPIELELKKLGLKEKEVKVYLAGLEFGPNSIKNIAEKAKIPRPTVYEIVKKLKEKELFVETKKGKKFINPSKSA